MNIFYIRFFEMFGDVQECPPQIDDNSFKT